MKFNRTQITLNNWTGDQLVHYDAFWEDGSEDSRKAAINTCLMKLIAETNWEFYSGDSITFEDMKND